MKKSLIITGGKFDEKFASEFLSKNQFDKIIAVDGGLDAVDRLGLMPDYIVGDFDTVDQALLDKYHKFPFIIWEQHKPEKDESDTELARNRAIAIGSTEVAILGATGGRLDHFLGNVHTLYLCMQTGVFAYLIDPQNKIYLLDQKTTFRKETMLGKYVSFFPYTDVVTGVTLKGFAYPLENQRIQKGNEASRYLSNELSDSIGSLDLEEGVLICVESRDQSDHIK